MGETEEQDEARKCPVEGQSGAAGRRLAGGESWRLGRPRWRFDGRGVGVLGTGRARRRGAARHVRGAARWPSWPEGGRRVEVNQRTELGLERGRSG